MKGKFWVLKRPTFGREIEKIAIAKNMIKRYIDISTIVKVTVLSIEKIETLV